MDFNVAEFSFPLVHHRNHELGNTSIPTHPNMEHPSYIRLPFPEASHENPSGQEMKEVSCNESLFLERDLIFSNWSNCYPVEIAMIPAATPMFQLIVNGIGISVVAALGILGNILSALVLSRPQMKSSVTCLLLGLAFCDTLLVSISVLVFSMPFLHGHIESSFLWIYANVYFGLLVPYLYPISTTAQTGSVYLTLAVTIERYVAVCHSLKARSICTWGRARICVAAVFSLSILYNLPRWWEIVAVPVCEPVNNLTLYVSDKSLLRDDPTYVTVYINWMYLVVMYLIPFFGLVVFNMAIYRQVRKANSERQQLSKLQRREMGLATMLLFVVVVFLLCNVLPLVNNILESFYDTSFDQLVAISNFLVVLNSSVNFVIYCSCGERFRRMFIRLVKDFLECRFGKRRNTYRGSLYRKSTYFRGGEFEEMSLASISARTANPSMLVDFSPGNKPDNGNRSSTCKTALGNNRKISVSQVRVVQDNYSTGRIAAARTVKGLEHISGRIEDGIPGKISFGDM